MKTKCSILRELSLYAVALTLCAGVFAALFQPWKADLRASLWYSGDGLVHAGWIQNIMETGWYESNDRWGYPGRQDLRDFPSTDSLHHLTCKVLALFTSDAFIVFNLFYILTFPLTIIASLFVLRRLGVSGSVSVAMSLLYTFQPYHLMRLGHLLLSAYYLAPFACLFALRIYQDRPFLKKADAANSGSDEATCSQPTRSARLDWLAAGLLCVAFGGSGAYYAFFSCFLVLIGGLAGAWTHRRWTPLLRAGVLCSIAFVTFLGSAASAMQHRMAEPNADVALRKPADAESYGLKIVQMLMPVRGHRIAVLRDLEGHYSLGPTPLLNENTTAALGLVGAVGLVYLLGRAVLKRGSGSGSTLDGLSILVLAAVLLGTIGGFGSAFAFFVSPWIRGYNRISIFIAFMALAASAILLDAAWQRWSARAHATTVSRWQSARFAFGVAALGAFGLLDQTHQRMLPAPNAFRSDFYSDRAYVSQLEASVPAGSAILQLPNCPYPNYIFHFDDRTFSGHEHLRPQLHSKTLRWSYGAMPGHRGYLWNQHLEQMALEQQCITLADAGFQGISVNRWGFPDQGAQVLCDLEAILGPPSLQSSDQTHFYFGLAAFTQRLHSSMSEAERARRRDLALNPVLIYWTTGFYEEQILPKTKELYRWGRRSAQFVLENDSREAQTIRLRFTVAVPESRREHTLRIQSELFSETLGVGVTPTQFERSIAVPPGRHRVHFDCDGPVQPIWQEPGKSGIVFRINHFHCEDVLDERDMLRQCEETSRLRE